MEDRFWNKYPLTTLLGSFSVILLSTFAWGPMITEALVTEVVSDAEPVAGIARTGGGVLGFLVSSLVLGYVTSRRW
jgi:hypothetical protein